MKSTHFDLPQRPDAARGRPGRPALRLLPAPGSTNSLRSSADWEVRHDRHPRPVEHAPTGPSRPDLSMQPWDRPLRQGTSPINGVRRRPGIPLASTPRRRDAKRHSARLELTLWRPPPAKPSATSGSTPPTPTTRRRTRPRPATGSRRAASRTPSSSLKESLRIYAPGYKVIYRDSRPRGNRDRLENPAAARRRPPKNGTGGRWRYRPARALPFLRLAETRPPDVACFSRRRDRAGNARGEHCFPGARKEMPGSFFAAHFRGPPDWPPACGRSSGSK